MIKRLDHLIVAVKDIEEAESNYTKLFGNKPVWRGEHKELGTINSLYNFSNIYLELLATNGKGIGADLVERTLSENGEGLAGLVLGTDDISQKKILLLAVITQLICQREKAETLRVEK